MKRRLIGVWRTTVGQLGVATAIACLVALLSLTNVYAAGAPAASQLPQSPHGTATLMVDGKVYRLTQGTTLMVPTTLPDGSKGYASATFGTDISAAHALAAPGSGDPCQTGHVNLSFHNAIGTTLGSYTLFQYWCWDGTDITNWHDPYAQWYGQLGWSLVNHTESLVNPPDEEDYKYGRSLGIFRFNGPLGIGCKSGFVNIYFYNTGNYDGVSGFSSEFGC